MMFLRRRKRGDPPSRRVCQAHADAGEWLIDAMEAWHADGSFRDHPDALAFLTYSALWEQTRAEETPGVPLVESVRRDLANPSGFSDTGRHLVWFAAIALFGDAHEQSTLPREFLEDVRRRASPQRYKSGDDRRGVFAWYMTSNPELVRASAPFRHAKAERDARRLEEERAAAPAPVPVVDWIAVRRAAMERWDTLETVEWKEPRIHEFLAAATPDVRHVALVTGFNADEGETLRILDSGRCDAATALHLYLAEFRTTLRTCYAWSAGKHMRRIAFEPRDGAEASVVRDLRDSRLSRPIAERWRAGAFAMRELAFDLCEWQPRYAAFERDLDRRGWRPDWMLPAEALLPFAGRQAVCPYIFWDWTIRRLPQDLVPDRPDGRGQV